MAVPNVPGGPNNITVLHGRGYEAHRLYVRLPVDCVTANSCSGQYMMPVDAKEAERLDIIHTMIQAARPRGSRLHHAPFVEKRDPITGEHPRVLDLGFGTGIWLLDMAEKYRNTDCVGVDRSNMAPKQLYHNVDLRTPFDYESAFWALGDNSFDFVHLQLGLGSVSTSHWPQLYRKVFRHLKPGGYFEHVEIDWEPRCDDRTLPEGMYTKWYREYIVPPYDHVQRTIRYNQDTESLPESTGFIHIQHQQFRIPTNGWSNDRAEHVAGTWWEHAMASGPDRGKGFEAMSLFVLTQHQHWQVDHARRLCEDAMREAGNPSVHAYNVLHVWWAQKPPDLPR